MATGLPTIIALLFAAAAQATEPLQPSAPIVLAAGFDSPFGIAATGDRVYWSNARAGTIMSVPLAGGVPTLLADGQKTPQEVVADKTSIYWANYFGGSIVKLPLGGGKPIVLSSAKEMPEGFALENGSVYWSARGVGPGDAGQFGRIKKVASSGGEPVVLADREPYPTKIAVDATHVYWLGELGVRRVSKRGGQAQTVFSRNNCIGGGLALDAAHVYWTSSGREIFVGGKAGGRARVLAHVGGELDQIFELAVDGDSVYVVSGSSIYKVGTRDGKVSLLAASRASPEIITVDDTNIYWSNRAANIRGQGTIMKRQK
jgi:hypothetical protein